MDDSRELARKAAEKDATLQGEAKREPDALSMNDSLGNAASPNLTQNVGAGSELNPEYGDAQDPTFEELSGGHHRDE